MILRLSFSKGIEQFEQVRQIIKEANNKQERFSKLISKMKEVISEDVFKNELKSYI